MFSIICVNDLIAQCQQELEIQELCPLYQKQMFNGWQKLLTWMAENGYVYFNERIGDEYCRMLLGSHRFSELSDTEQRRFRSARMLISYQKNGRIEIRMPGKSYVFTGKTGSIMAAYLDHLKNVASYKEVTIHRKSPFLWQFNDFLEKHHLKFDDLTPEKLADFFRNQNFTLSMLRKCNSTLRPFLKYLFDAGITDFNHSIHIISDNYKSSKLPLIYTKEEVIQLIGSVDRSTAIGKRDYLVLLLAAKYGWRATDIANFCFEQIDWENNTISFNQSKTGYPVVYPLLSSVGNAIIDYLKNGRPKTDTKEIIVLMAVGRRGLKLESGSIYHIVEKYIRTANIPNWQNRKRGSHALRFSFATNLLKAQVAMPIISAVLGHTSLQSTKRYLSIDIESLKKCSLPIPPLKTSYYEGV